ncbi:prolipoprotein diacylglyceryl transferase [Patescibacteria group bacterium]|nr:prolipoprotein diacylglyceryl transferase [Patescibacteria group bacterium]
MSFIGGIIGVIIAIFFVERMYKLSRKEFFIIFDLLLLIVPIGIVLGRIGNFLNQELYGIVVPEALQRL